MLTPTQPTSQALKAFLSQDRTRTAAAPSLPQSARTVARVSCLTRLVAASSQARALAAESFLFPSKAAKDRTVQSPAQLVKVVLRATEARRDSRAVPNPALSVRVARVVNSQANTVASGALVASQTVADLRPARSRAVRVVKARAARAARRAELSRALSAPSSVTTERVRTGLKVKVRASRVAASLLLSASQVRAKVSTCLKVTVRVSREAASLLPSASQVKAKVRTGLRANREAASLLPSVSQVRAKVKSTPRATVKVRREVLSLLPSDSQAKRVVSRVASSHLPTVALAKGANYH